MIVFLTALSCASRAAEIEGPLVAVEADDSVVDQPVQDEAEPVAAGAVFDAGSITQEVFDTTLSDIQHLVLDLNRIIRAGNYSSWTTYLSEDYRRKINSRAFLEDLIEKHPVFQGRVRNAQDYFRNVVVPSRANDRVDDIEFISRFQVRAYSEDAKGQRVILYNLEYLNGKWIITE